MKKLYFGDCLDVLKELSKVHPNGFIDLTYIDPPFNSKRDYNILFESLDFSDATAQKQAFADTWSNVSYLDTLNEIKDVDLDLWNFLHTLDTVGISKSAVAYLTTMAIRILYMHKVLKKTGSFYLHCDPTMSHYLKLVCDIIFGENNFRNEITWRRAYSHNDGNQFGNVSDVILWFSKSNTYTYNRQYIKYSIDYIEKNYPFIDETGKRYRSVSMNADGQGDAKKFGDKILSPPEGTHWRWSQERIDDSIKSGKIFFTKNGVPRYKQYLDEVEGLPVQNIWDDFMQLSSHAKERLGYPTQKPEALLERIINASSNEGELVADFFCGCGTTIAVAERLNRNWLGVDISHLAIKLIVNRLTKPYEEDEERKRKWIQENITITGFPKDIASAKELARNTKDGRFGFQDWVVEILLGGVLNPKRTADGGWDGYLTFEIEQGKKEVVLIEVKSGKVNVKNVREFIHVVEKQQANIGVFVCLEEMVTKEMQHEAKSQGYYAKEMFGNRYDKIQMLTVEDLLNGTRIAMPESRVGVFKSSTKKLGKKVKQEKLI
ncbi:MAG: site-specific DNA-methyltransferase [Ignavibacteria bacterium]|nr:site-specific DNA-methyltransferase [Ignavibacteria bacterium]